MSENIYIKYSKKFTKINLENFNKIIEKIFEKIFTLNKYKKLMKLLIKYRLKFFENLLYDLFLIKAKILWKK